MCFSQFEEKMRAKDAMIDKTRLKNNSLKASVKKMKQQLKQVSGWVIITS